MEMISSIMAEQTRTKDFDESKPLDKAEFSSTEVFDNACQLCADTSDKEAVGFCSSCDIYMCFSCIQHHKKIPLLQNHAILGKEKFEEQTATRGLCEMALIPITRTKYPKEGSFYNNCTDVKSKLYPAEMLKVHSIPGIGVFVFLLYQKYQIAKDNLDLVELGKVDEKGDYKGITAEFSKNIKPHEYTKCAKGNNACKKENVFFTIPEQSKVLVFCNQHSLVYEVFKLPTGGEGYDVVPFDNGLAICVKIKTGFTLPDWRIQCVNMEGEIITEFYYDRAGKALFKQPTHLASNDLQDILLVSDRGDHSVKALDTKGTVLFHYSHDTIWYPTGITCDEENNIYVACGKNLIQINKHGKKSRVLLTAKGQRQITFVCYNKISKQLSVADNEREITNFKFLP